MAAHTFETPPSAWHPKVLRLYQHWLRIHPPSGGLPGRQHFDPVDVPDLLPLLWLLDVQQSPLRFRYRLLGTAHAAAMRRELKGVWMDEAHAEFTTSSIYRNYVDLATKGAPSYRKGRARYGVDPDVYDMERLLLPMARNGRDVDMLLAITVYYRSDGSEAF